MSLQVQAVSPALLGVLQRLMPVASLESFYLVGGTALALHYGHRVSVDLDLFTDSPFDSIRLSEVLSEACGLTRITTSENTILGVVDGIKLDCITHPYSMIAGVQVIDSIRILSVEDIAAMKLNAIANRGCKKDFWDIYELMQHFSRNELLGFFEQKYPDSSRWGLEKSLVYFEDANAEPDPVCLKGRKWSQIKFAIQEWNRL